MNIDKLDKILLSQADVDLLFEWRDNHKDYVRNFKSVLKSGVIIIDDHHKQVFKETDTHFLYTMLDERKGKTYELQWDIGTKIGTTLFSVYPDSFNKNDYNQSIISLHASLMAYMEYYSDKKEYVDKKETVEFEKKKNSKNKKGRVKKSKKSPVRIRKKIYKINVNKEAATRDKNRYERKIEQWTVRGHWRNYSDGNRVWIKPYVKGDGENIQSKSYKL